MLTRRRSIQLSITASSRLTALALVASAAGFSAQAPQRVLILVNEDSAVSRSIAEYYVKRRDIPLGHVCRLKMPESETIERNEYDNSIARPLASFLHARNLVESILYIVTTSGVPLRIDGNGGISGDNASVDSELAALYPDLHGRPHPIAGPLANPFFGRSSAVFEHPNFPMYLVTRLTGYDFADVRGIIDRALDARNRGRFVIDLAGSSNTEGNNWLRAAAAALPAQRVTLDESARVLSNVDDVIAYAAWGSNDPNRKQRDLGFRWLPGAIVTEYVSTDARTFRQPPASWNFGTFDNRATWFAGSPQALTGDYLHQGATGASGHVFEPWLQFTPRPDYLLPAYYRGRTLAESYWLSIPAISWQNIVVGDPLCSLGPPDNGARQSPATTR